MLRRRIPVKDRFWDKVNKNGPLHPTKSELGNCWIWIRSLTHGYGVIWDAEHQRMLSAHRVAWELANGPISKGKHILHSCDNPPCINPSHLKIGTARDNVKDMVERGRAATGERSGTAILKLIQVEDIRKNYPLAKRRGRPPLEDRKKIKELCKKHRISQQHAWKIASGRLWKDLSCCARVRRSKDL